MIVHVISAAILIVSMISFQEYLLFMCSLQCFHLLMLSSWIRYDIPFAKWDHTLCIEERQSMSMDF